MTELEQTIMREIATLPENRLTNVLTYVRFLKLGLDLDEKQIEERFEKSWKRVCAGQRKRISHRKILRRRFAPCVRENNACRGISIISAREFIERL
jgi:hypothetical protein